MINMALDLPFRKWHFFFQLANFSSDYRMGPPSDVNVGFINPMKTSMN